MRDDLPATCFSVLSGDGSLVILKRREKGYFRSDLDSGNVDENRKISGMISDTKQNIEKVENIGHELRSVGGHLRNAGRAIAGKETQTVDDGQEGRFQSVVLAPMRATKSLLPRHRPAPRKCPCRTLPLCGWRRTRP